MKITTTKQLKIGDLVIEEMDYGERILSIVTRIDDDCIYFSKTIKVSNNSKYMVTGSCNIKQIVFNIGQSKLCHKLYEKL